MRIASRQATIPTTHDQKVVGFRSMRSVGIEKIEKKNVAKKLDAVKYFCLLSAPRNHRNPQAFEYKLQSFQSKALNFHKFQWAIGSVSIARAAGKSRAKESNPSRSCKGTS
jgi:hypothetical protein